MMRAARLTLAAIALCLQITVPLGAARQATAAAAAPDLQGKLYKSVFMPGAGALTLNDLSNLPSISEELRTRLARYLSRRSGFKTSYKSAADSFDAVRVEAKRRQIEQAIVALIEAPGVEQMAADYVAAAPIRYEWKGMHDGPTEESTHAEALLGKEPSSPLAPFFYVFIAHRQRAAFETYEVEKNQEGMRAAARKYRQFAERARGVADPIFPALMADLDRQPFVYIKTTSHPRDYNSGP
jgi:hypothetical protein